VRIASLLSGETALSRARRAELALLAIATVWGLTFVMVQDAIEQLPVMAFLAYRFIPAALLMAIAFRGRLASLTADGIRRGLLMGVFLAVGYITQTFGLEATTASKAGFITGLFVVITPLLARLVGGPVIGKVAWVAAAVSALGLFLLSGAGTTFTLRGDGLELLAALAFSAHIVATGSAVDQGHDIFGLVVIQLALVALVSFAFAAFEDNLVAPHGASVWIALVVTSIVASALGFVVQSWAQLHALPARTALILAAEPAFAGMFGWLLAGDRMGVEGWLGAALILAAIVVVDAIPRLRRSLPLPEG